MLTVFRRHRAGEPVACAIALVFAVAAGAAPARADDDSADGGVEPTADLRPELRSPEELAATIRELTSLSGTAPEAELDAPRLLGVDPLDEAAVERRVAELRIQLEGWQARRADLLNPASQDADDGDDDSASGGAASTTPHGSRVLSAADALTVAALDLHVERDELRLAFLTRPIDERRRALDGVEEARRLRAEQAAAEEARRLAEEDARAAALARQQAEQRKREARSEAAAELAEAQIRVEDSRLALAIARSEHADQLARDAADSARRRDTAARIEGALDAPRIEGTEADALYDEAVVELDRSRVDLADALTALRAPSRHPELDLGVNPERARYEELAAEREQLRASEARIRRDLETARRDETVQRWARTATLADDVSRLNRARLALLPRLSTDRREVVLGVGPEGLRQLRRELHHLRLMGRWYLEQRARSLRQATPWFLDLLGRSSGRNGLLALIAVVGGATLALRRRQRWLAHLEVVVRQTLEIEERESRALRWLGWLGALWTPLVILAAVLLGGALAMRLLPCPEIALARTLALTWAGYRVTQSFLHHFLVNAPGRFGGRVGERTSDRILRSLRLALRYTLLVLVIVQLASALLGKGYLYTLVINFAWLGVIPIGLWLLRHWRDDTCDAYLAAYPQGRLAGAVRAHRSRWTALGVVVPAVAVLAGRAAWIYLQTTVLRFERSRKALAYLFRRQLATQAETLGHGTADLDTLPEPLRRAFRAEAVGETLVPHQPGIDEVVADAVRLAGGARGSAVALVGPRGIGKTAWLGELERRIGSSRVVRIAATGPVRTEAELLALLREPLAPDGARTLEELADVLLAGESRVIAFDDVQNLVLRALRGGEAFEALARLVRRTSLRQLWVCAFSRPIWDYLEFRSRGQDLFGRVVRLGPWPEPVIDALIQTRMAASGVPYSFEDLLPEDVLPMERALALRRTRERFMRLLWDYTDGIPRLAMYFWLRSLVPDAEGLLRVRPFDGPDPNDLETLGEAGRFVLHAVATHEALGVAETAEALQCSRDDAESTLALLHSRGYVTPEDGRYRVTNHWDRAAVRYLRRKHLLHG